MLKHLLLLAITGAVSLSNIATFDSQKLTEHYSGFKSLIETLHKSQLSAQNKLAELIADFQAKEQEGKLTAEEKEEKLQLIYYLKEQEEKNLAEVEQSISSQIKDQISEALSNASFPVIKNDIIMYGGKDITTNILNMLKGKKDDVSISDALKVGYINFEELLKSSTKIAEARKYVNKLIENLQSKREQLLNAKDKESSEKEFQKLIKDIEIAQKIATEIINKRINEVSNELAKEGFDLITVNSNVFANGKDITDKFIKLYDSEEEIEENELKNSRIAYVELEYLFSNLEEANQLNQRYIEKITTINKFLSEEAEKIEDMKKSNASKEAIAKAEEALYRKQEMKKREIFEETRTNREQLMNKIKAGVKRFGKGKYKAIFVRDSLDSNGNGVFYAGKDISKEIAETLNI